jgi:hypothetical protein
MRVIRFVTLLAFAFVLGVPASALAIPATVDCSWSSLAVPDHGGCGNAPSVSGCGLLCASGSAACAEPSNAVAETSSLAPCSHIAFPLAAQARAPDTAPPKRTIA